MSNQPSQSNKGIKIQNKQTYKQKNYYVFGKFILNRDYLNNKNKLLVKYGTGSHAPVPKIRQQSISDEFKSLINDILDTKRLNKDIQKRLQHNEQDLLELLLTLSGLKEQLKYQRLVNDIGDLIHRFTILQGSVAAGNDSSEVIMEIKQVMTLLKLSGKLSESDFDMLLQSIS